MPVDPGLGGRRRIGPDVSRASLCGRSKAKKGAFCSTLPMITIASPKSAWACLGAWASDTNFSRPLEILFGRVPLLAMDAEIGFEPGIDYLGEPIQLRLPLRWLAAIPGRHGEAQHLLLAIGDIPKRRAASRWLIPSEQARRALRYKSTVKILPPSLSPERQMWPLLRRPQPDHPPLPWPIIAPPFSATQRLSVAWSTCTLPSRSISSRSRYDTV